MELAMRTGAVLGTVAFQLGPFAVRWYGVIISIGMLIGIALAYRETVRQHLNPDDLIDLLLLLIPSAVIGARLYYVIFRWQYYAQYPEMILKIWKGGLAIHGGVIAGVIVLLLYCRHKKQDFLRWADIIAPSLILGQAIGRWGNFANAEAFGPVIEPGSFWSWVPLQVYADGAYHHPTFLYESIWDALIFLFLVWLIRRPHRIGTVFADYLIFYSIGRFFIEQLRTDSLMIGPLRTAVLVSALGIVIGVIILWRIEKKPVVDVSLPPEHKVGSKSHRESVKKKRD